MSTLFEFQRELLPNLEVNGTPVNSWFAGLGYTVESRVRSGSIVEITITETLTVPQQEAVYAQFAAATAVGMAVVAPHAVSHENAGADEVATGTPAANAIPKAGGSGEFADGWISESSVTQHDAAIDHNALLNYTITQHRSIDDSATSTTGLWSSSKIASEVSAATQAQNLKASVVTVATADVVLAGEQTINGVLTSTSRVGVVGQTLGATNGIYVTSAGAWTRSTDADTSAEVTQGLTFFVSQGTKQGFQYILTTPDPITLGVTVLSFVEVKRVEFGTTAGTATEGNDPRVPTQDENDALVGTNGSPSSINPYVTDSDPRNTDSRAPTGAASGDLTGAYPGPTVAALAVTAAKIAVATITEVQVATANKDGVAGTPSLRTLGTSAVQACAGNDSRLSDARTPTAHASTHLPGGTDALTTAAGNTLAIGAAAATGSAASFSRSDHVHAFPAPAAPVNVTKAASSAGSSTSAARDDHKHDVTTAAASANPPGTASAEGTSTSLARADHTHALAAFDAAAGTFCEGNDSRLSDARTPTGAASGDLTGTYPGPTVAANAVGNTKLATVATATFKGRTTAGTGNVEDLTATQATALLNNLVGDSGAGGTKGLVPAPAAGDAAAGKFLKADATWAAAVATANVDTQGANATAGSTIVSATLADIPGATLTTAGAGTRKYVVTFEGYFSSGAANTVGSNIQLMVGGVAVTASNRVVDLKNSGYRQACSTSAVTAALAAGVVIKAQWASDGSATLTLGRGTLTIQGVA